MADMEPNDREILRLERSFWFSDAPFYEANLTADCRMTFPSLGLLDRDQAIAGIAAGPRWDSVEMREEKVQRLGADAAVVSYAARARRGEEVYEALVGSTYVWESGTWKLTYHQHTPVTPQATN